MLFRSVRALTNDLNVIDPATTLVTAGPFGVLTNTSLDSGNSSAHGYLPAASLPAGARAILGVASNASQVVSFSYQLGAGFVFYSTIPLDCYLPSGACLGNVIANPLTNIYTPNVLLYLHTLNTPLRFRAPVLSAGNALPLFLGPSDNSLLSTDRVAQIQIYSGTNVAAALSNWTLLANPLVLTNGLLRVDGINATGAPPKFFRAVENP